jgi:hypothetical protein
MKMDIYILVTEVFSMDYFDTCINFIHYKAHRLFSTVRKSVNV